MFVSASQVKYHSTGSTPSFSGPIALKALGERSNQTMSVSPREEGGIKTIPILLESEHDSHSSRTLAVTVLPFWVFLTCIHLLQFPL